MAIRTYTFRKAERLCKKKIIDELFEGSGCEKIYEYPFLVIHKGIESDTKAQVLISVGKKHLKKAFERNRLKRQIRELFRINKEAFHELATRQKNHLGFLILYIGKESCSFFELKKSFEKIVEKIRRLDK